MSDREWFCINPALFPADPIRDGLTSIHPAHAERIPRLHWTDAWRTEPRWRCWGRVTDAGLCLQTRGPASPNTRGRASAPTAPNQTFIYISRLIASKINTKITYIIYVCVYGVYLLCIYTYKHMHVFQKNLYFYIFIYNINSMKCMWIFSKYTVYCMSVFI